MSQNNTQSTPPRINNHRSGPGAHLFKEKVKIKDTKGTLRRLSHYLGDQKKVLFFVVCICLLTTIINIFGTRLNGTIVDDFIKTGDMLGLTRICLLLIGFYAFSALLTFIQNRWMIKLSQHTTAKIRKDLFDGLQDLPLQYFDTHSSGDLMSRLTNDVDNINNTLSQGLIQFISGIITVIGVLIAMLLLSPILTFVGLLTTPLMFLLTKSMVRFTQPYFKAQQKELGNLNGYIEEMVSGQKAVLLFSAQEQVVNEFDQINKRLTASAVIAQSVSGFMGPINNLINNLTYLLIAVTGAILVVTTATSTHPMTVGLVFAFILYMRSFTRPINEILNLFQTIQSALAGAERVFEMMDEVPESNAPNAIDIPTLQGEVSLERVDFSYVADKPILKKATIQAKPGETIAIVGPTGAGKTTIINLLTRFYDIDGGTIRIDGHDIQQLSRASLRSHIAMVLQDTYLFSQTVRENIEYGNLSATEADIVAAAKLANAHHFIMQLENGYDTVLSDNGSDLSQGQRQLLAIARAILSNASILILDEATSSIDTRTEVAIQNAMLRLMKGKTTFIIAHRLSTIRSADQILVLKEGEIIEQGTHLTLLAQNGFYATLHNSATKGVTA